MTLSPTVTATSLPEPADFEILDTTLDQSGTWDLTIPYTDARLPEVIVPMEGGYQLSPDFQVQSIDLLYEWWGLGDPVLDYQHIELRGGRFWKGNEQVAAYNVQNLVTSIANLHREPQMLNNINHTDDYPVWAIEITGMDNTQILLNSTSNGLSYAPWNVISNGQIYSQFDGQIGNAVSKIFEVSEGQPMAWTSEGSWEEGYLIVDTVGWPGQLSNGFSGLLPLQSGFNYRTDPQKGEIYGYIRGRSSIGGFGNMIIGTITGLQKIELDIGEDQSITCESMISESDDPEESSWEFVCPVGKVINTASYNYPIRVTFTTDKNQTYASEGTLFGNWNTGTVMPVIPYPDEIGKILQDSPAVQDLTSDHHLVVLEFNAAANPLTGTLVHRWTGTVVLLGRLLIDDRILPYSVTIPVEIKDSQLVQWDLDRSKLHALLQEVLYQPITSQFMTGDPNLVLNLYYAEGVENQIVPSHYLNPCADLPFANGLPNTKQPLRAFAFNQRWDFSGIQTLIINDQLRLYNLNIYPASSEDVIWNSLLPVELQPKDVPSFERIAIWPWSQSVFVSWDAATSQNDIDKYLELAKTWSGKKETYDWGIEISSGMLDYSDEGRLTLISCK